MTGKEFPGDIEDPGRIFATAPIPGSAAERGGMAVPTQQFSSLMKSGTPMETAGKSPMISPFGLMQGQPPLAQAPTTETLLAQINSVQSTMGDINQLPPTIGIRIRRSAFIHKGGLPIQ